MAKTKEKIVKTNDIIYGNYYQKRESKNPIERLLVGNFDTCLRGFLLNIEKPHRILEIGCGEGDIIRIVKKIFPFCHYVAVDINKDLLNQAKEKGADEVHLSTSEPIKLPYFPGSFDLVIMVEVLEHLHMPEEALRVAKLQTKKYFLASVPWEPIWRMMNMIRLKYLKEFGNTPGHINHWSRKKFRKFISNHFFIKKFKYPFPWLMILGINL